MDKSNNNRRHAYYVCVLIYKQISERTVVGELCALFYTLSFMHTNFNFGWIVSFRFLYLFSLCICLGCDFLYIPLVHMSYFALFFLLFTSTSTSTSYDVPSLVMIIHRREQTRLKIPN